MNMADGGQYDNIGFETPRTEIMKSRIGKVRTRSGHISHRHAKLGIEH